MDVLRLNQEKVFDPKVLNCKLYEGEYSKEQECRLRTLRIVWILWKYYLAHYLEYGLWRLNEII